MHIAVHCITDAKSAAAVARMLNVTRLTLLRKTYANIVRELYGKTPRYTEFYINRRTGEGIKVGDLNSTQTQEDGYISIFPEDAK